MGRSRTGFSLSGLRAPGAKIKTDRLKPVLLKRGYATLLVPDPNGLIHLGDKNLSVTDLARGRALQNRVNRSVHQIIRDDDFNLDFRQEIHRVFAPAVDFGVSLLPPMTPHIGDGH